MRLCRFQLDEIDLAGFYLDDRIIPIVHACETYCDEVGVELLLSSTDDLLDYLPPDGASWSAVEALGEWVGSLDESRLDELAVATADVQLLLPIPRPSKILLLAGNYAAHVIERGGVAVERAETFPYVFMKPPTTTLTHPGDPIRIPKISPDHIDYEAELAVVIGRTCRDVEEADALDYVAGYTILNDITDRKFTPNPGRKPRERDKFFDWLHGKWHDTFCPVGPCILPASEVADPQTFPIKLTVNGEVKQDGSTGQMIFPVAAVISFLSRFITLEPGDLISTGTPSGVGSSTGIYLKPGDVVVASIEGIGELTNPLESEE
jgi:2-keto-4-pentenoate hydratase/2-oxohepta-3-ene-1,7-dioic acid hydratase in catechol pathway